jgi:hypothetical protein
MRSSLMIRRNRFPEPIFWLEMHGTKPATAKTGQAMTYTGSITTGTIGGKSYNRFNDSSGSVIGCALSLPSVWPTTVCIWTYWSSSGGRIMTCFGGSNGSSNMSLYRGKNTNQILYSGNFSFGSPAANSAWHHYAATLENVNEVGVSRLYKDGVLYAEKEKDPIFIRDEAIDKFSIGNQLQGSIYNGGSTAYYRDCMVFDSVLSDAQILELYNSQKDLT